MREIPEPVKRMMDKYGKEFKDVFGVEVNKFVGKLWMVGIPDFDILEFEKFLVRNGYDIENEEESMAEFVDKKYGKRGSDVIRDLLKMEVISKEIGE